jgi:hypothetical protein
MTRFEIIDAKPFHCGQIVRHLRIEHRAAVAPTAMDAHRNLRSLYDDSIFRRAWALDGKLAGIAGISGPSISSVGFAWLAMTQAATSYPVAVIREGRKFLADAMVTKRELATTILGGDDGAKRFAVFLGFHCDHDGPGSPAFSRPARRDLARFIDTNPDIRIPTGRTYAIALGYHLEAA